MFRPRTLEAAILAMALSACSAAPVDPLDEAQASFEAQDYLAAYEHVQTALVADADSTTALELLARIQLAMGRGEDVAATLDRLEAAGGGSEDLVLVEAEAKLQSGETDAAIELIGNARSAEAWRLRALAADLEGDEEGARAAFRQGRSAEGERVRLYTAEASYLLARGETQDAARAVARAVGAAPERVETLFVAGRLAEAQGNHLVALSNYLRIIEKVPLDRPALIAAIAASERADKPEITRHLIAYGAETRPLDPEFVYQQARVRAWDGEWADARELLQASEAELADHDPARLLYAESLLQLGQVETARAIAAPVVARNRGDAEAMRVQAAIEAASS
ncbi:tetratricopeptide repeat protein [Aurantiacibacter hainanensis]|uniref:tetratricopeptide repeat protein n=1 Tax=Aurantiacibacter hainanensis TaxID=3076114 RepID=UPI0030C77685